MPSSRRLKVTGLVALLTVLIIFYVTNGASNTKNSPFYTRTVAAINSRQNAQAREDLLEEERQRHHRVERLEREHNAALSAAHGSKGSSQSYRGSAGQRPLADSIPPVASQPADPSYGEKSVAGRKYMKDGKVVTYKSLEDAEGDGVAKVGNVEPKSSHTATPETEEDRQVTAALNEILRKGPIIVFSKTFCPFSKKAKHILLDLYSITPPPHVVELDEHKLGQGLQSALEKLTGRRTVPNVLINGKSIGGGDDIQDLHNDDQLIDTITSLGGKRIFKILRSDESAKREMRFKA